MLKKIYSLYDKKSHAYLNPIVFNSDGEAMRWFTTVVNREDDASNIYHYPQDFILCYLGTLDDQSGQFNNDFSEMAHGNTVKVEEKRYTIDDIISIIEKRETH